MAEQERPAEEGAAPEPDEFAARLEEELKRVRISDVLVQTLYTLSSLGYHKLGTEHRDLPQARLAIDSLRALLPVLKDEAPAEQSFVATLTRCCAKQADYASACVGTAR